MQADFYIFLQEFWDALWNTWGILGAVTFILEFLAVITGFSFIGRLEKYKRYKKYERRFYWTVLIFSVFIACFLTWQTKYHEANTLHAQLTHRLNVDFKEPVNFKEDGEGYFQGDDNSQLYRIKISNPSIKAVENVQARIAFSPPGYFPPGFNLHFRHDTKKELDRFRSIAKGQDEFLDVVEYEPFYKNAIHVWHTTTDGQKTLPRGEYIAIIRITGNDVQDSELYFLVKFDSKGRLTMTGTLSSEPAPKGPEPELPAPNTYTK